MNDKEFRAAVYQKYEQYCAGDKNRFVKEDFRRNAPSVLTLVLLILMFSLCVLGATAGTYHFSGIWKDPEPFDYEEELKITEEMKAEALSEADIREKAKEYTQKLCGGETAIRDCQLVNNPAQDKTSWELALENGGFLILDGKNGQLIHFSGADIQREYAEDTDAEKAESVGKELLQSLDFDTSLYSAVELDQNGDGRWWMDCYRAYDGVINPYQCLRILFSPSARELLLLRVFEEPFENNPYVIDRAEALRIAREYWGEENVREITAEKAIEKMNAYLYQKENGGSYRTEQIVRNVWQVTVTWESPEFQERLYVDGTTGERIGGDQTK